MLSKLFTENSVCSKMARSETIASKGIASKSTLTIIAMFVIGLFGCNSQTVEDSELAEYDLPDVVDYNFHIKPIMSDTCFACHGADLPNVRAGLSLSTFELATTHVLDSGNHPIVPGEPDESEAFQRIMATDPNMIMPPPSSNLTLTARQKAMFKKWIEQGAEYKKHWSFITPTKQELPEVQNSDWPVNPIDHFVLKQIEDNNLSPSPEADKETLLRRVTFDLTGLPPTIEEIDTFLADNSPQVYEKVVDRLLSNQAYGERIATEWLDVARYADTHGYATDPYRDVSPYRDWVIEKFNQNMPFDEFVTWQLAGDLLPNPSKEQKLATAFNRMHTQNNEGGIVLEEFRVEYVKDRVQSVGTGLLGLTLHCAQCHDHKYDDIPAKHYYQTYAMFNNNDDAGQISWDPNDIPVPTMLLTSSEEEDAIQAINLKVESAQRKVVNIATDNAVEYSAWLKQNKKVDLLATDALVAHYPLDDNDSTQKLNNIVSKDNIGYVLFSANEDVKKGEDLITNTDEHEKGVLVNGDDALYFPAENYFKRAKPFAVAIKAKLPSSMQSGVIFHHNKSSTLYGYKGFDLSVEDNHWIARVAHTYPYNAIALRSKQPVKKGQWQHITMTYDGSSKAKGVHVYIDGEPIEMDVERDNLYKDINHTSKDNLGLVDGLKVGARWRDRGASNTWVNDLKVWSRDLSVVEVMSNANLALGKSFDLSEITDESLTKQFYDKRYSSKYKNALAELQQLRIKQSNLVEPISEMMVMQELKGERRKSFILARGLYSEHAEAVEPGVPENVYPFDPSLPKNRVGLAKWLTDPKHPLVARVVSNRYWAMLMGNGIVRTPEDFGNQGELPTHPKALDWLSREFIDSGWDVKHLIKTIAMSATYRQSSDATPELSEKDPENVLFARGPRGRLTAEMLRDNVLAASGLLVQKVGGKSVYPYQPEGLWKMNRAVYEQSVGDDLYRRSMYTVWKRNAPPPSMHNFDTPTRTYSVGTRQATNTPLQALTMMNDPQYVEAGRVLAEKLVENVSEQDKRLVSLYRLLTSKYPDENELSILQDMYSTFSEKYTNQSSDADLLLAIGDKPTNPELDQTAVAALSTVANLVINHDATVIKR